MRNEKSLRLEIALGIFLLCYFVTCVRSLEPVGNILSTIGTFTAAGMLFYAHRKAPSDGTVFLLFWACLLWFLADLLWAGILFFYQIRPDQSVWAQYAYLPTDILISAAAGVRLLHSNRKWDSFQHIADMVAVSSTGLIVIWILLFRDGFNRVLNLDPVSVVVFLGLLFDVFTLAFLLASSGSLRNKLPFYKRFQSAAFLLFVMVDAAFWYAYAFGMYHLNSINDFLYVFSLLLLAYSAVIGARPAAAVPRPNTPDDPTAQNGEFRLKALFLLIAPMLLMVLNRYNAEEILLLLVIAVGYELISLFLQKSVRRESQLEEEKRRNATLESSILERTRELEEANGTLDYFANRDVTTNLLNRRCFIDELEKMMGQCHSGDSGQVALFVLDLDRFKAINEAYGHEVGDMVLMEVSRRLSSWNHGRGTLARLGGDEFVLACSGNCTPRVSAETARQMADCCREPILVSHYRLPVQMSIGISLYPWDVPLGASMDANSPYSLLKNAEMAMYHAKRQNGNCYAFFSAGMQERVFRETELEMLLKNADYDREFELYFQPQFRIRDKKLVGAEALIRWNSPEKGRIMPFDFISIAEESGAIIPLGRWILKTAVRQAGEWNRRYGGNVVIGINVSAKQFYSSSFLSGLKAVLEENDVDPHWLDIEITESIAMLEENGVEKLLKRISDLGISISIDDFGTGYSSFNSLKRFRFDRLKIAKSMVDGITTDERDANIVNAIAMMAGALHLRTIAEGVEQEEQLLALADLGCDEIQGYLWGKPVSRDVFESLYLQQKEDFKNEIDTHPKTPQDLTG